jgi:predicted DsbA family dithiol-disulfide isomerase
MHGRIFERQGEWSNLADSPPFFEKIAGELGLDVDAYKACVKDHVMRPMILADAERATTAGARSTPTFFIGNQALAGAEKIEAFRSVIAKAQADLPK